ncbi:hypothetical protein VAMP_273n76 [Candidatus Vampirococcus lugosii]|uniref:Uncharacterized protein n=2 Tax=Candidatus Vampirococcus lugosii TaxID=2789015 RepID=A0ABS5QPS9_9BACT|nr:hypothetical protein [Candidatus Vampirococcus lugosii]
MKFYSLLFIIKLIIFLYKIYIIMYNKGYEQVLENLKKSLEYKIYSIFLFDKFEKDEIIKSIITINDVNILYNIEIMLDSVLSSLGKFTNKLIDSFDENELQEFKKSLSIDLIQKSKSEQKNLLEQLNIDLDKEINI